MEMIEPRLTRKRKASLVPLYAMSAYESITRRQTIPILVPQATHNPIWKNKFYTADIHTVLADLDVN